MSSSAGHLSRVVQGWGASQTCAYCHGFAKIPTLIRGSDGRMHLNPDAEQVKSFSVRAEPWGFSIPPGESKDFAITPPAEEESLGDFLIQEFREHSTPAGARSLTVEFLSLQTDKTFQNAPVFNTLVMGNAHLNCCLPCCTLVQATNTLMVRVTNFEAVPVEVRITAHGLRFLPKSDELRARMLEYWNMIPSYPFFLTMDDQEVLVPAGQERTVTMTVPGTGDFEMKYPRCDVIPVGGPVDPNDILVEVAEGIGRQLQSDPLPLAAFFATPTLVVPGFPGDLYRAASACSCPPAGQLFKRNTKVRHTLRNTSANDAIVRMTYAGCFHKVDECPPGRSLDRLRSLEPTIGPLLIPNRDYCPPEAPAAPQYDYEYPQEAVYEQPYYEQPQAAPVYQAPAPAPAPAPAAPRTMFVPGYGTVVEGQGGPMAYLWQSYQPGPGGSAVPIAANAAAHGYSTTKPWAPPSLVPFSGLAGRRNGQRPSGNGRPQQPQQPRQAQPRPPQGPQAPRVLPGQAYFDPIAREWRRA